MLITCAKKQLSKVQSLCEGWLVGEKVTGFRHRQRENNEAMMGVLSISQVLIFILFVLSLQMKSQLLGGLNEVKALICVRIIERNIQKSLFSQYQRENQRIRKLPHTVKHISQLKITHKPHQMKQALTSIILLPILYFLLSGTFIVNITDQTLPQTHSQFGQTHLPSQTSYLASHNSLIITSNQGISNLQNSLSMYEKIYITQNVSEVQDSLVRMRGILLIRQLEELRDFSKMSRTQVDRYELIVRRSREGNADLVESKDEHSQASQCNQQRRESIQQILQINRQQPTLSLNKQQKAIKISSLLLKHYPFLPLLISSQFLSSMLAHLPNHQKLLYLPKFISLLLQVDCYQYDGQTINDQRYSIDLNNQTQLYDWLKGQQIEEKCGIRLDNRLVISVIRRQSWLREIVLGREGQVVPQQQVISKQENGEYPVNGNGDTQHQADNINNHYEQENSINNYENEQNIINYEQTDNFNNQEQGDNMNNYEEQIQFNNQSNDEQHQTITQDQEHIQVHYYQQQQTIQPQHSQQVHHQQHQTPQNIISQEQQYQQQLSDQTIIEQTPVQQFHNQQVPLEQQNQQQNPEQIISQQGQAEQVNTQVIVDASQTTTTVQNEQFIGSQESYNNRDTAIQSQNKSSEQVQVLSDQSVPQTTTNHETFVPQRTNQETQQTHQSRMDQVHQASEQQIAQIIYEQLHNNQQQPKETISYDQHQQQPEETISQEIQQSSQQVKELKEQQLSNNDNQLSNNYKDSNQNEFSTNQSDELLNEPNHINHDSHQGAIQQEEQQKTQLDQQHKIEDYSIVSEQKKTDQDSALFNTNSQNQNIEQVEQPVQTEQLITTQKEEQTEHTEHTKELNNQQQVKSIHKQQENIQDQHQQQPQTQNIHTNPSSYQFNQYHQQTIDKSQQTTLIQSTQQSVQQTQLINNQEQFNELIVQKNETSSLKSDESVPNPQQQEYIDQSNNNGDNVKYSNSIEQQQTEQQEQYDQPHVHHQDSTPHILQQSLSPKQVTSQEQHHFPINPAFSTPLTQQGLSAQQKQQSPPVPLATHQPQTMLQFSTQQPPIQNNLLPQLQNSQQTLMQHTFKHQRQYPLPKQPSFQQNSDTQQEVVQNYGPDIVGQGGQYSEIYQPDGYEGDIDLASLASTMKGLLLGGTHSFIGHEQSHVEVLEQQA